MAATEQTNKPAPTDQNAFTSFADRVNYDTLFANLASNGIQLTDEEKEKCKQIVSKPLRNHDGGHVIGSNPLEIVPNFFYILISCFQNIMGMFGGNSDSSMSIADKISSVMGTTSEQDKLRQLQLAEADTYTRLKSAGGNLAAAAELITGVKPFDEAGDVRDMQGSVYNQIAATINLPKGTRTDLNPIHTETADISHGLPPKATEGLTPRAKSA